MRLGIRLADSASTATCSSNSQEYFSSTHALVASWSDCKDWLRSTVYSASQHPSVSRIVES